MSYQPQYSQPGAPAPQQAAKSNKWVWVILGAVIGVPTILMGGCVACVAIFGAIGSQQQSSASAPSPTGGSSYSSSAPASCTTVTPACPDFHLLQVVKSSWQKGGFGTVAVWKVTFRNTGKKPVGNIKFRTSYGAETGSEVDKGGTDSLLGKDTLQKVIKPGETRTIEVNDGFVHDEAVSASFSVVSWEYVR